MGVVEFDAVCYKKLQTTPCGSRGSLPARREWLGDLDSNQDSQIQKPVTDQEEAYASALETWLKRLS
jgi:hypothetical protein